MKDVTFALPQITALSHEFGTPEYVKGGGGNTSFKTDSHLWIKPSGTTLAGLKPELFVPMVRERIEDVFAMVPPADAAAREEQVKNLLMSAVAESGRGRPSVETPLHHVLKAKFVVHTHPPLVNGMTCGRRGETVAKRLFPDALWVPYTDPGYVLSKGVKDCVDAYEKSRGAQPAIILLENHGIFVSADTPEEIRALYRHVMATLTSFYAQAGVATALVEGPWPDPAWVAGQIDVLRELLGPDAAGVVCGPPCALAAGPLTPDHMVYAKAYPYTGDWKADGIAAFVQQHGYAPRVFPRERALFAAGTTPAKAELAMTLARDGALVMQLAKAFGGAQFMHDAARRFIESWEVESYRESMATSNR